MSYTDKHGRPEITCHPDIVRGTAAWRIEQSGRTSAEPTPSQSGPSTTVDDATAQPRAWTITASGVPGNSTVGADPGTGLGVDNASVPIAVDSTRE